MRAPQNPHIPGKASMYKMSPVYYKQQMVWEFQRHQGFELSLVPGYKDFEMQIIKKKTLELFF